jgi:hypothetical protein
MTVDQKKRDRQLLKALIGDQFDCVECSSTCLTIQ